MNKSYVIILYLRLSVEDIKARNGERDESNSIANQRDLLHDFVDGCSEFEGSTVMELCDDGYSGTNLNRPSIQKLLQMAKANAVDCIIVKDFSRFGRDYLTVSDYVDQIFPFLGVRFISVNDGYDSADYNGMTSGVDVAFRNVVYAYYSKDISQKVRSGKRTRAKSGKYMSSFAPIGYRKDRKDKNHLVIDEESAEIVRRIFRLAGAGMSVIKIVKLFNAERVSTPSELKNAQGLYHKWWDGVGSEKLWDTTTVTNILRDERYLGKNVYGKRHRPEVGNYLTVKSRKSDWIIVEDCHEPLITPEEFQMAQAMLKEFTEENPMIPQKHLFSGKLRCGVCNYSLQRKTKPTPRYSCTTKYRTEAFDCMKGYIAEADLAEVVYQAIVLYCNALLDEQKRIKKAAKAAGTPNLQKQLTEYQAAFDSFDEQKAILYEKKNDGIITQQQYIAKRDALTVQQEELRRDMDVLNEKLLDLKRQKTSKIPQPEILTAYLQADHLTREMVISFVDCIYVYSDKSIHIEWLFDEKGAKDE